MNGSPPCDRFEREGALKIERGEPLDEHFAGCPGCLEARRRYLRIAAALGRVDERINPPAGWEARVLARVDGARALDRPLARRAPRLLFWAGAAAAALGLALLVGRAVGPQVTPDDRLALSAEVVPGDNPARVRSGSAAPGDRVRVRADVGASPQAEIRVYRGGRELVLRCPGAPACGRDGGRLDAELSLTAVGRFQVVLIVSDAPIPEGSGALDADMGRALGAGAKVELSPPIDVY